MKVAGILLAGGKSTRMGQDKAELVIQGQTLMDRQMELLQSLVGKENVFLSGRQGTKGILDQVAGRGPVEGLRSMLPELQNFDAILVIPVDMPNLQKSTLTKLLDFVNEADVVHFKGHSLPALFRNLSRLSQATEELSKAQDPSVYSFKKLYQKLRAHELEADTWELLNVNTPEEWNEAF